MRPRLFHALAVASVFAAASCVFALATGPAVSEPPEGQPANEVVEAGGHEPRDDLRVTRLAEGVYAAVWAQPLLDPVEGNSLFVVNEQDVVVVDSALLPSSTRRMIAELRKITDKPVRYVVNTHWHDDHHGGNYLYRELWPEVEFIAHRATRARILELVYEPRPGLLEQYREQTERYSRWSETGRDDEGEPLDEPRRQRAGEVAALLDRVVREASEVREMPPDLTFDDRLVLRRGARTIEIRWLGRGNTAGDVVVHLPEERIVASGDLLVSPIPFFFGSYYDEWIDTLEALDALGAEVLVPGHGAILHDRTYLRTVQELLRSLVAETERAVAEGLTLEQAKERIRLPEWRERLAGEDEKLQRAFDAYVLAPGVERAYRQARGEDPPEGRA